jgi:hypothetical protein
MSKNKPKVIAFYLPQFHPIKENDIWWGKGFTEWTNVAKAKKMFFGHYQPRIPTDLGFYDLRLNDVRIEQAKLAKEAGVSAFCYWHYWFGNGNQLLERPLQEVVLSGEPDFPFCLAWANHTWQKKNWNSSESRLSKENLMIQSYPGLEDIDLHFYKMLPTFKDCRYYKIENRLVFVIYNHFDIPDVDYFMDRWQNLARENGLSGFFFISHINDENKINADLIKKFDAINLHLLPSSFNPTRVNKFLSWLLNRPLDIVDYSKTMKKWESDIFKEDKVFPTIYPNWDTTPRISMMGQVLQNSTPEYFKVHVKRILSLISHKKASNKVIFLKSWNEWAEGNYMEPDLKFGKGYINALKSAIDELD